MAYNDKKILDVLRGELGEVPDRCEGYQEELRHVLGDVLIFEREHEISRTTIVKNIADQVNTLGMLLYRSRVGAEADDGGDR